MAGAPNSPGLELSPEYLAESRVALIYVMFSLPLIFEFGSTALRLCVRTTVLRSKLVYEDYLMIFATITSAMTCITTLVFTHTGFGRHIETLTPSRLRLFLLSNYIFCQFYQFAIASTKLSVLALYHRIFVSPGSPHFRIVVLSTASIVVVWLVVLELILIFECRPTQAWWGAAPGKCANLVAIGYFTNITNLSLDMWIFAMPIPTLLRMHASRVKRLGLCFLFSVGLGTCAISAARLTFVVAFGSPDVTSYIFLDETGSQVPLGIMSTWECCGGVLCANLPIVYKTVQQRIVLTVKSLRVISREKFSSSRSPRSVWSGMGRPQLRAGLEKDSGPSDPRSMTSAVFEMPATVSTTNKGEDYEVDVSEVHRIESLSRSKSDQISSRT